MFWKKKSTSRKRIQNSPSIIRVFPQDGTERPWSMMIGDTLVQPNTNAFESHDVELESLDVVAQALKHSPKREKVVIYYDEIIKHEAKIYAETFRHAQFLDVVLEESK